MPADAVESRAIHVFVSSTFRDMQAERDELVKRVFPQLRNLCEQRRVSWTELDLRWGITDEQRAEGRVLPVCLAEIENCRPYFLGPCYWRDCSDREKPCSCGTQPEGGWREVQYLELQS